MADDSPVLPTDLKEPQARGGALGGAAWRTASESILMALPGLVIGNIVALMYVQIVRLTGAVR